jgi:hypothetical protein
LASKSTTFHCASPYTSMVGADLLVVGAEI